MNYLDLIIRLIAERRSSMKKFFSGLRGLGMCPNKQNAFV